MPKMNWVAGWNMPGYLPETDPVEFERRSDAIRYLADEMDRWAEQYWGDEDGRDVVCENLAASLEADNSDGGTHDVLHMDHVLNVSLWVRRVES